MTRQHLGRGAAASALALLLIWPAVAAIPAGAAASPQPLSAADKNRLLYELGVQMSGVLQTLDLSDAEFKEVTAGLADGLRHRADIAQAATYEPGLQTLRSARVAIITQREKDSGRAYLQKAATAHGARTTPTGLVYIPTDEGTGPSPTARDRVRMNYVGRLVNGTVYDSSAQHGEPATLSLSLVMPCFTEALQLMKVGGKSRIVCPSELAYGDRGSLPAVLPGATLEFEIELLAVNPSGAAATNSEFSQGRPADRD